jgi:tRNA(fMet)-specific endonuclease VapC
LSKYLLDTNICIYFLNGKFNLDRRFENVGIINLCISEISVAELKFGVEKSNRAEENRKVVDNFISQIQILPIFLHWIYTQKKKQDFKNRAL